jgi:VanZ family protein
MNDIRKSLSSDCHCRSTRFLRVSALLIWAGAMAYLSLAASVATPTSLPNWDKLNHFAAYAILAMLLARALIAWHHPSFRLLAVAWSVCMGYGLLLESLQWLMGIGRQWELGDLLANGLGSLAACAVFRHTLGRSSVDK